MSLVTLDSYEKSAASYGAAHDRSHGATVGYFLTRLRRWNIGQGQFMRDFITRRETGTSGMKHIGA